MSSRFNFYLKFLKKIEIIKFCTVLGLMAQPKDVRSIHRYILPQTNIRLKLLPAKADFALHAKTGNKYDYRIESCILHIRRV